MHGLSCNRSRSKSAKFNPSKSQKIKSLIMRHTEMQAFLHLCSLKAADKWVHPILPLTTYSGAASRQFLQPVFPSSEENMLPELQKSPLHIHSGLFCVFPRISIFYAMFRSRFFYCRVWDGNRCTRETLPVKSPPNHFDGLLVLASVYFPRPLPAKYFRRYVGLTAVFGMGTGVPPPPSTPTKVFFWRPVQ